MMLTADKFEAHSARLVDPSISPDVRKDLATEIRDSMDLFHSQDYQSFLHVFLPAFKTVLTQLTRPQFSANPTHHIRAVTLETLNRLPHNDILKAKVSEVLSLAMDVLKTDNEVNAALAIHIILDLHKNFRNHLDSQAQPFLDFVRVIYTGFGKTVEGLPTLHKNEPVSGNPQPVRMAPSTQSFKVIVECPLLIMLLFQLYPQMVQKNIQVLLPLMVQAIQYEIPIQHLAKIPKSTFHDFIAAQVKTVSFLAYLLKQFPDRMNTDESSVPRSVVKLMQSCPGGAVSIRKELLVATRHILSSPYRSGFYDQLDLLLDEKVLVGTGRATTDALRPIAYSFLAELVHCVRLQLSIPQLEKIVFLFSTNVHDPKFSHTLQTSSVRLLLNLIEGILKKEHDSLAQRSSARGLLVKILETMISKYVTLGEEVPRLLQTVQDLREEKDPIEAGRRLCEIPVGDPLKEVSDFKALLKTLTLGLKTVIWSVINIRGRSHPVRAVQAGGVQGAPPSQGARQLSSSAQKNSRVRMGLLERESELVSSLLSAGRKCFQLYARKEKANGGTGEEQYSPRVVTKSPQTTASMQGTQHDLLKDMSRNLDPSALYAASLTEEKEVFELFAQIFTVLDPPSFQDVFGSRIRELFEYIVDNPAAISVPQHFLANSGVSKYFADILLNFLVENIQELEMTGAVGSEHNTNRRNRASALLKLFKIVFASVSLFPTNEPVLQLHLATIVRRSLKHASSSRDPVGFLQMLKALFKSINNDKNQAHFDFLYLTFVPLLEHIYSSILSLAEGPCGAKHKDLLIELSLLVPARTSNAFPYLETLIKPIVWALETENETAAYGARSLEFWVDILQPAYLDQLFTTVEPALTKALHKQLRLPRNPIGVEILRVMGKLGSRSRIMRGMSIPFRYERRAVDNLKVRVEWPGGMLANMEIETLVRLTIDCLLHRRRLHQEAVTVPYGVHAWRFLFSCLNPFLVRKGEGESPELNTYAWNISSPPRGGTGSSQASSKPRATISSETEFVKSLLFGLVLSTSFLFAGGMDRDRSISFSNQRSKMDEDMKGLCRYFALLTVQENARSYHSQKDKMVMKKSSHSSRKVSVYLSYTIFVDALVEAMSQESQHHAETGMSWMKLYIANVMEYCSQLRGAVKDSESNESGGQSDSQLKDAGSGAPMEGVSASDWGISSSLASFLKSSDEVEDRLEIDSAVNISELSTRGASVVLMQSSEGEKSPEGEQLPYTWVTMSCIRYLIEVLSHFCYKRTWNCRRAAAKGLQILTQVLPRDIFRCSGFVQYYMLIYRALLFMVRDSTDFSTEDVVSQGRTILCNSLQTVFAGLNESGAEGPRFNIYGRCLREVVIRLLSELVSASATARETARCGLRTLSQTLRCRISELIMPLKDHILRPLKHRPLRQHSIALQLGFLEAINFCLELDGSVISANLFSSPLREYVLIECIYLLENSSFDLIPESEDGVKPRIHENKYLDAATTRQLLLLKRQVLEVLRNISTHCSEHLKQPVNDTLYKNTIGCFFKNIQSRDAQIVQSCKQGLRQAIDRHQRPKELLQQNLRPMLSHLGDYKMLNIPYLQGLSRILELFSNWFNISLGEKLLEHLQKWTDPEKISTAKKIPLGSESRVAAAILELFHLLPATASKFLSRVVDMVIRLEAVLLLAAPGAAHLGIKNSRSASTSPYRAPLLKYCEQHALKASEFLLSRMVDEKVLQLFFVLIGTTEAVQLRKTLMENPKRLFSPSYFHQDGGGGRNLHMIALLDLLSKSDPKWLGSDPVIMSTLIFYWKTISRSNEMSRQDPSSSFRGQELKTIAEIFIRYCTTFQNEVNLLFELLAVFSFRTTCDFTFVKRFLENVVTRSTPNPSKNSILTKFFSVFMDVSTSQERKLHALHYIIIPLLSHHLKRRDTGTGPEHSKVTALSSRSPATPVPSETNHKSALNEENGAAKPHEDAKGNDEKKESDGAHASKNDDDSLICVPVKAVLDSTGVKNQDPIDTELIQKIVTDILDQSDETLRCYDELLSVELLRLATVLIKHTPNEIGRYRKQLIRFGWNNLKREESTAKFWAFIAVTQFFESYQAPTKLVLQVYVALLRACQTDGRSLVQRAVDTLMPVLPRHLSNYHSDHKYPIWIRYTKKILLEEGHSVQNLVHIWQIMARHPQLFFSSRAQFVPFMANSLSKFALSVTAGPENRRLGLDLVALILSWEDTRRENSSRTKSESTNENSVSGPKKRPRDGSTDAEISNEPAANAEKGNDSQETGPPAKLQKANDGHSVPTTRPTTSQVSTWSVTQDPDDYRPSAGIIDLLAGFLVQMPIRLTDQREASLITRRSLELLESMIRLWPDVSIRLHFVEKLFTPIPAERQSATLSAASSGKGPQNSSGAENPGADSKTPKTTPSRNDKDQVRKRMAVRNSALVTSLLVSSVAATHQGSKFVERNTTALRAFIQPSLTENSFAVASQFASLLPIILEKYIPILSASASLKTGAPKNPAKREEQLKVGKATTKPEPLPSDSLNQNLASSQNQSQAWALVFVKELHSAVETCLKSPDYRRNYSGLLVLKSLWTTLPLEFLKYQDILLKSLQRMTKEHISSYNAQGIANGTSVLLGVHSGGGRIQHPSDRSSGTQPQVNSNVKVGSIKVQDGGEITKGIRLKNAEKDVQTRSTEVESMRLCLSMVEYYINSLDPTPKRHTLNTFGTLIEKCSDIDVLLELVKLVDGLIFWKPGKFPNQPSAKEPLTAKEKAQLLQKMSVFEKIKCQGSQKLMDAYLSIILRTFKPLGESSSPRRPDPKLERVFMIGLKSYSSPLRQEFFDIYESAVGCSASVRLQYVVAKQEWEYLAETLWIKNAVELLISSIEKGHAIDFTDEPISFSRLFYVDGDVVMKDVDNLPPGTSKTEPGISDEKLHKFESSLGRCRMEDFTKGLIGLVNCDHEIACRAWVQIVPQIWSQLTPSEQGGLGKSLALLLTKEYHYIQVTWPTNNIQALLESIIEFQPLPCFRANVIRCLGSRWNAWHSALTYFERRENDVRLRLARDSISDRTRNVLEGELEDIADAQVSIFLGLQETDNLAGAWKKRARSQNTVRALSYEQMGLYADAQDFYAEVLGDNMSRVSNLDEAKDVGGNEVLFCEERWIECAKSLCQWEVLTEFSRTVVSPTLLHECLWRIPDWVALKDLLRKKPVQDSSMTQIYEAYVHLQENKLGNCETHITEGFKRTREKFASLPESADLDATGPVLVQFQQLVELQESAQILGELNALSRHGSENVNVDQKIEKVRMVLNTWRERLPSPHEPLRVWNELLLWRNHVHAVVVNVLEALKEAANQKIEAAQSSTAANAPGSRGGAVNAQIAQVQAANAIAQALPHHVLVMGVNETAWNVHRFAKACRKQGFPDVALYVLQKLYPFGTMELTEYFVKIKEVARAYMVGPRGLEKHLENGLHELSRCNMDHLSERQRAQLFSLKGKLLALLGREDESVEAVSTALFTSADVGSAWLSWGQHCDNMQKKAREDPSSFASFADNIDSEDKQIEERMGVSHGYAAELAFRESAVKCYLQAVRFGSRRARAFLSRVLRLLSLDVQSRLSFDFTTSRLMEHQSSLTPPASKPGQPQTEGKLGDVAGKSSAPTPTIGPDNGNGGKQKGISGQAEANKTGPLTSEKKGVSKALSLAILDVPSWMWLPWLPQLLQMLCRTEGLIAMPILSRIARQFPQAIYFPLKAYMDERISIDCPERHLFREALKLWRPIAVPLRSVATPAHLQAAIRYVHTAKEQVHKANLKYLTMRKELEKMEGATPANGKDQARFIEQKERLKANVLAFRKSLEKSLHTYQLYVQRQRQIQESIPGGQGPHHIFSATQSNSAAAKADKPNVETNKQTDAKNVNGKASDAKTTREELNAPKPQDEVKKSTGSEKGNDSSNGARAQAKAVRSSTRLGSNATPYEIADTIMAQIVKYHQATFLELEAIATDVSYRVKIQKGELLLGLMNALLLRCYQSGKKSWREDVMPSIRSALEEISRSSLGIGMADNGNGAVEQKAGMELADLKEAFAAELAPQTAREFPNDVDTFIYRLRRWQRIFQKRVDALPEHVKLENICRRLLNINGSDIEVFGQYCEIDGTEPCAGRHVRIRRISGDVKVIQRATGCCRGISILGSDGKWYKFLVESYIGRHVRVAENRAAQMYRLLNEWVFAKDAVAVRHRVHLAVPRYIATGFRSRLVYNGGEVSSVSEGLDEYLAKRGESCDDVIMAFREAEKDAKERRMGEKEEALSVSEVFDARVEAYETVCRTRVGEEVFAEWIKARMRTVRQLFSFRKRFAESVGCGSAVSFVLAIGCRRPQNMMFSWESGAVQHGGVRVLSSSSKGVLEHDEAVPFRLTRNLRRMMGANGVRGVLYGSLVRALRSMMGGMELMEVVLESVMRDEVEGYIVRDGESAGKTDERRVDELEQVERALRLSVAGMKARLGSGGGKEALALGDALVEKACAVHNVARMECCFQAWY
eukprot:TRINITY_DN306_c0_g1_i1.p1 TRINITY_DN306_c0_g1~~TRINITY_DN306_c0_g1_i1.p1  ORF type:complete len:4478 (+),score=542.02 TRINITY_DN306_c0_g1_i1:496-13929(+)